MGGPVFPHWVAKKYFCTPSSLSPLSGAGTGWREILYCLRRSDPLESSSWRQWLSDLDDVSCELPWGPLRAWGAHLEEETKSRPIWGCVGGWTSQPTHVEQLSFYLVSTYEFLCGGKVLLSKGKNRSLLAYAPGSKVRSRDFCPSFGTYSPCDFTLVSPAMKWG